MIKRRPVADPKLARDITERVTTHADAAHPHPGSGRGADSAARRETPALSPEPAATPGEGAAVSPLEDPPQAMVRVTVYATLDQVERLDQDRVRVRRARRQVLDRTAIIRALLEGYRRSGLDLVQAGVWTEEQLASLVAARLADGA